MKSSVTIQIPEPKLLKTLPEIARFMRCGERTLHRWIKYHNFPASKLPTGVWVVTIELINLWLLARRKAMQERAQHAQAAPPYPRRDRSTA